MQLTRAGAHAVHHVGEFRGKLVAENPAAKGDKSQQDQTGNQEVGPDRQGSPALKRLGNDMQENRNQDGSKAEDQNRTELPQQHRNQSDPDRQRGVAEKSAVAELLRLLHQSSRRRWL